MNHSARLLCILVCLFGSLIRSSAGWFGIGGHESTADEDHASTGYDLKSQLDEIALSQHYVGNLQDPGVAKDLLKVFNLKCLKAKIADELAVIGPNEFECFQKRSTVALNNLNSTDFECFRDRSIDIMSKMDEKCYKKKMLDLLSVHRSQFKFHTFLTVMVECFDPSVIGLLKDECFAKVKSEAMDILFTCVKKTKAPLMNVFIDCMDFHEDAEVENEEQSQPPPGSSQEDQGIETVPKITYEALEPSRYKTPFCLNNSNCQDVNTWNSYCCDDLRKCCDLLKYTFKDSNRLYNFLVVYREPRTVYSTVMYGLPVVTLFVIGCVGILLADLYSFCHYLFCRRCIDCLLKRRRKKVDEKYHHIPRDASQSALLDNNTSADKPPISNV